MGADTRNEDVEIAEIKSLSVKARNHISHHVRNELHKILIGLDTGKLELVKNAVEHINHDLNRVGC